MSLFRNFTTGPAQHGFRFNALASNTCASVCRPLTEGKAPRNPAQIAPFQFSSNKRDISSKLLPARSRSARSEALDHNKENIDPLRGIVTSTFHRGAHETSSGNARPVVAKRKLSQNRSDEVVDTIISELEAGSSAYADPRLPAEMRRAHDAMRAARGARS